MASYDTECPYCGADIDINHDDGYGYGEDEIYEQECEHCGKIFTYTVYIRHSYTCKQAPCKNGEEHKWMPINGCPKSYYANKHRCKYCGEEEWIDKDAKYNTEKGCWEKQS